MDNPEWKCKIDEGSAGLLHAHWSPDSRHILTTSEFHVIILVTILQQNYLCYLLN
jgi:hypothetical protein